MRNTLTFAFGLVVGRNYVWCLDIAVIFMGFEQAGAKRCGEWFKVINWGGNASHERGILFKGKRILTM